MSRKHHSTATKHFNKLIQFRQAAYACLGSAKDSLFELSDAVIGTPAANSFTELSCAPYFRRRWPSVYEALQVGRLDRQAMMKLYCQSIPMEVRPTLVGDHTAWSRPSAYTMADRTVQHQPTPIPGNRPITLGHGYSTLVWPPENKGSWALPLLHELICSKETPFEKAASN